MRAFPAVLLVAAATSIVPAVLLIVAATSIAPAPAAAQQRWCGISNEGANNCSFASMADCRASMSGNGGNCMPAAPVGHRQPGNAKVAPPDPELEAVLSRVNKKSDKLILCRGC